MNESGAKRSVHQTQRIAGLLSALFFVLLLADSALLALTLSAEGLAGAALRAHLVLGLGLCLALPLFIGSHFISHRRHRNERARRIGFLVGGLGIVGCVLGFALWLGGAKGELAWLVTVHELMFVLALAAYLWHRLRALATPALVGERIAVAALGLVLLAIWAGPWAPESPNPQAPQARALLEPGLSQGRTVDGHLLGAKDLANLEYCAQCHPSIAKRWESSAHRVSSLNDPFYAATLAEAQKHRTPDQLKFCGGCHDPLLLFTGGMDLHPQPEDPLADAGITCLACHAITELPGRIGNGSYVLASPEHYAGYDSGKAQERELSNRLIRSKPAKHIASFAPAHLREADMCLPCHKAHIPPELNEHRFVPGQNEWDAWHQSGAGGNSARTFYPPASTQKRCQDCHMPQVAADDPAARDGKVADHAFLGANTALPFVREDREWLARSEAFLQGVVSIDVGAIELTGAHTSSRLLAPSGVVFLPAGAPITIDLIVRNRKSGHLFPGGIADLRETWLELTLTSEDGSLQQASGWLDAEGQLDAEAHRWNATLLDREGEPLDIHEVEDTYVVLSARRIMLGASDLVRIGMRAPTTKSRLRFRVLHRKFSRDYVRFALGDDAPRMPVTVIASAELVLSPGEFVHAEPEPGTQAGARLRDLGIGYLLRGDTTLARHAARAAAQRLRDDPGPHLDLARAALSDGALQEAEEEVRRADSLAPGHPTAAWLLARLRAAQGSHDAALDALDVALAAFPQDRELLVMKGETLYQLERNAEATVVLKAALQIDPEHLGAHALLTKIYDEAGDAKAQQLHQKLWDRYRPHSQDKVVTEKARRAHPALDRRANRQYVLTLKAPASGWTQAVAP